MPHLTQREMQAIQDDIRLRQFYAEQDKRRLGRG